MSPRPLPLELIDELYRIPEAVEALNRHAERSSPEWVAQVERVGTWLHERLPHGPEGFNPGDWEALPLWVRLQLLDLWGRWWDGSLETCRHWPVPQRPQPVAAALWRPGLIACVPCSSDLLRLSGEADRTCDGCGRVVEGLEVGDGIYPCGVSLGPLLVFWGACAGCRPPTPSREGRRGKGKR